MVWGNVDLWGFQSRERFLGLKALVSWLLKYGKATKLFVITVWLIWNQRNEVRLHQNSCSTEQLAQLAKDHWEEYNAMNPVPCPRSLKPRSRWIPPTAEFYKLNYDGAVLAEGNNLGIGVVI